MWSPLFSTTATLSVVIPGLGPGIYEFISSRPKLVDAKAKPWHDDRVRATLEFYAGRIASRARRTGSLARIASSTSSETWRG